MISEKKDIPFIITISYLAALLFIRASVFLAGSAQTDFAQAAKLGLTPDAGFHIGRNIILFGYHIHHFYIGILFICLAGWFSLVGSKYFSKKQLAAAYGVGLGLFFDEIGLLLTWGDYYSSLTYFLSLFLAGIFLNIIFFHNFWESLKKNIAESSPNFILRNTILRHNTFLRVIDFISKKTGKTEKVSLIFTGLLYIGIALIIFIRPKTVRYLVALMFVIQGLDYFLKFSFATKK